MLRSPGRGTKAKVETAERGSKANFLSSRESLRHTSWTHLKGDGTYRHASCHQKASMPTHYCHVFRQQCQTQHQISPSSSFTNIGYLLTPFSLRNTEH